MIEPNTRTRELRLMEFVSHWTRRAELHWVAPAHWAFIIASRKRSSDPAATAFRILASKRNIYKRGQVSDSFRSVRGQVGPGEKCLCFILLCSGAVLLIEDLRSLERLYLPQPCGCLCNTKQRGGVFQSQSSLMFWFRWSITNLKKLQVPHCRTQSPGRTTSSICTSQRQSEGTSVLHPANGKRDSVNWETENVFLHLLCGAEFDISLCWSRGGQVESIFL